MRRGRKFSRIRSSRIRSARISAIIAGTLLSAMPIFAGAADAQPVQSAASQSPMPGEALAFDHCLTCHEIKGGDAPGNVGPPLADMKSRFPDRKELAAVIFDETKRNPLTVMPPFGRNLILTKQEIEQVVDFLYTR